MKSHLIILFAGHYGLLYAQRGIMLNEEPLLVHVDAQQVQKDIEFLESRREPIVIQGFHDYEIPELATTDYLFYEEPKQLYKPFRNKLTKPASYVHAKRCNARNRTCRTQVRFVRR